VTFSHLPFTIVRQLKAVLPAAALLGAGVTSFAQSVIMSLPEEPLNAPVVRQAQEAAQAPSDSRPAPSGRLFSYGPVSLRTNLMYRFLKAEGLPSGARTIDSDIQTITPTISLDFGSHWSVAYIPSWIYYSAHELDDTFDQAANIRGAVIGQVWTLLFNQDYSHTSPTLYETGRQTTQEVWSTSVSGSRSIGSRSRLDLNGALVQNYPDFGKETRDWTTTDWFTVQVTPGLHVGVGPTFGYTEVINAPDMTYQRYMGRVGFSPTNKLSLSVDGGMEYRQTNSSASKDLKNPIIDASLNYRPFETTAVSLTYAHTVNPSLYDDQVSVGARWNLHFEQRLLVHFYFSADWSRSDTEYQGTSTVTPAPVPPDPTDPNSPPFIPSKPGRKDTIDTFNCRLTTKILKRATIALTYQQTENQSSQLLFDTSSKQYGIEINCAF
jgi:hypothetical protein